MTMQNKSNEKRFMRGEKLEITPRTKVYIIITVWVLVAIKTAIPFCI
ncbi:hypothetical protein MUO98_02130 [Candidatus Bathyarchaeota archaeon]|nr:hypothetical protein [Candidatus Bathyarchaeota archaeon]